MAETITYHFFVRHGKGGIMLYLGEEMVHGGAELNTALAIVTSAVSFVEWSPCPNNNPKI